MLGHVLRKRGLEREARASQAVFAADRVLAELLPQFAPLLRAKSCKQGTLVIAAEHSIAAQECQAKLQDLLSALHMDLGEGIVSEIRIIRS